MRSTGKIRILFLCDEIKATTAGSEQHLAFLLQRLSPESYETHLALLRNTKAFPLGFLAVPPILLNFPSFKKPLKTIKVLRELRWLIRRDQIQIIHVFFRDSELLSDLLRLMPMGCSWVVARRSLGHGYSTLVNWVKKFNQKNRVLYLVNSEAIKGRLFSDEEIPEDKIRVIYNPVNMDRLERGKNDESRRGELGINNSDLVVGIVANIRPVKDYETFFAAAEKVAKLVPNSKFVIVGSREEGYWHQLQPTIRTSGLNGRLVFTGPLENPISIIQLFDVGVLCSTSEGLSNSLVEYASVGIPSVATDVGGNREVVKDGKTGYLVPSRSPELLSSKIVELLIDAEKRKEFGNRAREFAFATFDQEKILRQYDEVYRKLITG